MKIRCIKLLCKCGEEFKINPELDFIHEKGMKLYSNKNSDSYVKCDKCNNHYHLHMINWGFNYSYLFNIKTFYLRDNLVLERNKTPFGDLIKDVKIYSTCYCNNKFVLSFKKIINSINKSYTRFSTHNHFCDCGIYYSQSISLLQMNNVVYGLDICKIAQED